MYYVIAIIGLNFLLIFMDIGKQVRFKIIRTLRIIRRKILNPFGRRDEPEPVKVHPLQAKIDFYHDMMQQKKVYPLLG